LILLFVFLLFIAYVIIVTVKILQGITISFTFIVNLMQAGDRNVAKQYIKRKPNMDRKRVRLASSL